MSGTPGGCPGEDPLFNQEVGPPLLNLRSLLQEAGRRHVARVAVLYAAVAFGILEAADIIIPALGLEEWTIRWVIALALIGFPVTLVLAWIYDFTPSGVVRTTTADEEEVGEPGHRPAGTPFVSGILLLFSGALVAIAAFFAYEWSVSSAPPGMDPAIENPSRLNPLRVAVLPFEDLDGTDESGFLANGIHDDILNHLAKIDTLEVISRTTVLQYRNTDKSAQVIGMELGAGSILEGSVRRLGDRIRVVAQLIDARTDNHIWSEDYDREEADIFRVQSEIAQEIARALQVELTSAEVEELETTTVVTGPAYTAYAEGITQWDLRENRMNAVRAAELFLEATELAPDFAQAHAALSQARMWLFWNFPGSQDQAELARQALDRALDLAPNAVETLLAQGYFYFYGRGDAEEALRYFRQAQRLKPSDASVISAIGLILRGQGEWDGAVDRLQEARSLDPRSYNLNYTLAETLFRMRRFEDAEDAYQLASVLAPEVPAVFRDRLRVRLAMTEDTVAAREYLEGLPRNINPAIRGLLDAELAYFRGDFQGAMGGQGPRSGRSHERLAILYHLMGNEALRNAHADTLRMASEEVLQEARANPGPVQTGVISRARAKLGLAYALLGQGFPAVSEGFTAVNSLPISVDAYEGANHLRDLAVSLTILGDRDMAIDQLETALSVPSTLNRADLILDPVFQSLRDHPRFQALLETTR
jgi:TolB-like protein/Flp pilus assembly protein TadD